MIRGSERSYAEKAAWRNHCIEDRTFCLESSKDFHGKEDTHFVALMLQDAYQTNAIPKLELLSEKTGSDLAKKHILEVIYEIGRINSNETVEQ